METFRALVVDKAGEDVRVSLETWDRDRLMDGEVTVRVAYSSVNYKDGLAARADGRVVRRYPLVPGIDLVGTVLESADPRFRAGDEVIAHGYDIGVAHHGGYAEVARLPAGWVAPLPAGLGARDAMALGTAGFTAGLSIERLEHLGLRPGQGPVLVAGASGGVGSAAVAMLAARGYEVAASTGSPDAHDYLRSLGAALILDRAETSAPSDRPLERPRWAGAVDPVGGATLAYLLRTMDLNAGIALSGNVGGPAFSSTVFPFILRGVNLLGIDSANLALEERTQVWRRMAADLRPPDIEALVAREVGLEGVPEQLEAILRGDVRGRVVVRVSG